MVSTKYTYDKKKVYSDIINTWTIMPFFKNKKKKPEDEFSGKLMMEQRTTHYRSSTTQITTYHQENNRMVTAQRSISVSGTPSSSQLHAGLSPPSRPTFGSNRSVVMATDAKPIVNMNYQSPYRENPVYKSWNQFPRGASTSPIKALPARPVAITAPKPPPPTKSKKNEDDRGAKWAVKKTGKKFDLNPQSIVPIYKTSHTKNRGQVLIINNIMFKDNKTYRHGAEIDDKNLEILFKGMNFRVKIKRNLSAEKIGSCVYSFSQDSSLKDVAISIVVVMSHGTNREISGGYTEIIGVDEKGLATDKILEYFTAKNCRYMANKPKIFLFQCCRGDNGEFAHQDAHVAPQNGPRRTMTDMLIGYSTIPGFTSYRDPNNGTWYIQTLCEVFSEHAHDHDVEELLKIVDSKLSKFNVAQTSSYESRGFKKCYLHP